MPNISIAELLIITGGLQGLIFTFLLLVKLNKDKSKQNLWLALFILFFSLVLVKGWYIGSGLYLKFSDLIFFPVYFSLGIGPVFYLYIKCLIKKDYKFKQVELLHFVLPLLQFIYHTINFLKPIPERLSYFQNEYLFTYLPIEDVLGILGLSIYYVLSFRIIKKYQLANQSIKSVTSKKNLYKWINHFIIFSYSMLVFWALTSSVDFFIYDYTKNYSFYYPVYLWMVFILYWIIYRGFIQTNKIRPDALLPTEVVSYSLPEKDSKIFIQKLKKCMEEDKLFLKSKLTLNELAEKVDINSKYLSQLINKKYDKSFTEFVNEYRIGYAKEELLSIKNTHLTISAISEKCGFNSKSTFNEVFKKLTNLTPSQFIKSNA
ncbi:MAG: helix-turn-helix transcriptional regulator [Bacteroidales bacterium]|nr:helix-turn-helix transcriptional regulator [Bacteroidales bacterium]